MPIRPENVGRYPANWKEIRTRILDRAGHCCERCGKPNAFEVSVLPGGYWYDSLCPTEHGRGGWRNNRGEYVGTNYTGREQSRLARVVLTIAHWPDPAPENCDPNNLWALCQACHLRIDMDIHQANRRETRRRKLAQCQPALLEAA